MVIAELAVEGAASGCGQPENFSAEFFTVVVCIIVDINKRVVDYGYFGRLKKRSFRIHGYTVAVFESRSFNIFKGQSVFKGRQQLGYCFFALTDADKIYVIIFQKNFRQL